MPAYFDHLYYLKEMYKINFYVQSKERFIRDSYSVTLAINASLPTPSPSSPSVSHPLPFHQREGVERGRRERLPNAEKNMDKGLNGCNCSPGTNPSMTIVYLTCTFTFYISNKPVIEIVCAVNIVAVGQYMV